VQLQPFVQAAAIAVATEDDDGVSKGWGVADGDHVWEIDNRQHNQKSGNEQASDGAKDKRAEFDHGFIVVH